MIQKMTSQRINWYITILASGFLEAAFLSTDNGCSISVHRDFPKDNEPFLLKGKVHQGSDFFLPTYQNKDDVFYLNRDETFYLACPGGSNYLSVTKRPIQEVVCQGGNVLSVNNENIKFNQLLCQTEVKQSVRNTNVQCARNRGIIIEIGFNALGWHKILTICHNFNLGMSYYAMHTIRTKLIQGGLYKRSHFKKEATFLFKGYDPNVYYKRTNQKTIFQRMVGNTSKYANEVQFLSRGHLSPVRDFPFKTWQKFTFVYSNAAPQWMSINGGAWKNLEKAVRENKKADLYDVATGTFGVYKIENKNGQQEDVSLNNGKIPVPAYFWKIVQDAMDKSCIAFMCTNDPFLTAPPAQICTDICSKNNWNFQQKNLTLGFIYCCSYSDFKRAVVDVPNFDCKHTLRYV